MKFLIVDDNGQFRACLKNLILKPGDECRELDDGLLVKKVYSEFHPDWTLLDIRMKNVDGFTAAQYLTSDFPEARFAFISDYDDKRFRAKANELGAAAFFGKENLLELYDLLSEKEDKAKNEVKVKDEGEANSH